MVSVRLGVVEGFWRADMKVDICGLSTGLVTHG